MNVDNTDDNMKGKNNMLKKKFYDYVDKYLMAMQIDIEEYETLPDTTLAEFAFKAARTCRNCFEIAWEYDEAYNENTINRVAPDLKDELLEESVAVLLDQADEEEIEVYKNTEALKKFVKLLFDVEDIDEYARDLRKEFAESGLEENMRASKEAVRKAYEEEEQRENTGNLFEDLIDRIVFDG